MDTKSPNTREAIAGYSSMTLGLFLCAGSRMSVQSARRTPRSSRPSGVEPGGSDDHTPPPYLVALASTVAAASPPTAAGYCAQCRGCGARRSTASTSACPTAQSAWRPAGGLRPGADCGGRDRRGLPRPRRRHAAAPSLKGTAELSAPCRIPKDTDENYLAVWQARETVENGLRLGAVGNLISTTVLTDLSQPAAAELRADQPRHPHPSSKRATATGPSLR